VTSFHVGVVEMRYACVDAPRLTVSFQPCWCEVNNRKEIDPLGTIHQRRRQKNPYVQSTAFQVMVEPGLLGSRLWQATHTCTTVVIEKEK